MIDLLKQLCRQNGVSGDEDAVRDFLREQAEPHADSIRTDALGNLIVFKKGRRSDGPKLLLADEPIASLDPESARIVMETLHDINQNDGITVVVTLHQVDYALRYCERIVALRQGHVFYDGSSQQFDNERFDHLYRSINRVEENAQAA